jgi:hypothetical protein
MNLVLGGSELLENSHVLARTPNRVYWHVELELSGEQQRQLGQGEFVGWEARFDGAAAGLLNGLLDRFRDEWRILSNVLQCLLRNALEGCVIVETKITSVDDVVGPGLFGKIIERS